MLRALACAVLAAIPGWSGAGAAELGRTDPNERLFPDSSLVDFRHLLHTPAGKRGFLRVSPAGRFVWSDGTRARFWGVNISNASVFTDRARIDQAILTLARAGCNMVRLEALDSSNGLLTIPGQPGTRTLNPERLAIVDYWTSELRKRGIYYYFNLLDFREFSEADGVPNAARLGRAAKPYAVFDEGLIALQKEFAEQLLLHRNPHTGLRYVDDPALALVEVFNEHGLFMKAAALDNLAEPYNTAFRQRWNQWLLRRYGSREGIRTAWGRLGDVEVLGAREDPSDYSVRLPAFAPAPPPPPPLPAPPGAPPEPRAAAVVDTLRAPTRLRDGVRFLYQAQREYLAEMRRHLRAIGLRVPITAAVSNDIAPDVASVADELDFTTENYFADHPMFQGRDWQGIYFFNDGNHLRLSSVYQAAPWLAALRWRNKPVVVREWSYVWPNRYRVSGVPEMLAYSSLQDFDAVLLFGYQLSPKPDVLSDFDHQCDPPVWGLFALAAQAFLRGDVAPARHTARIVHGPERFWAWPAGLSETYRLAWHLRINSTTAPAVPPRLAVSAPPNRAGRQPRTPQPSAPSSVTVGAGEPTANVLRWFAARGVGSAANIARDRQISLTGQIVRNTGTGRLVLATPRTVAIAGEFLPNETVRVGDWALTVPGTLGALMAVSLDGRPLAQSTFYVVKFVTRAENTNQRLELAPQGAPARYALRSWGQPPIRTLGRPSLTPLRLKRGKQDLLVLEMEDGTWELVVKEGAATLVVDTVGIRGKLLGRPFTTRAGGAITVPSK